MTRSHATTDSRLLQNLIKAEKAYTTHLASTVASSQAAAAALKAWGTSEARDVAQTSSRLADLLHEVADAQGNHLEAIRGYREALKDVADREASIRTIVRDRDILVSRLIKASKKNGDVAHAQRELTACEEVLEAEERALVGVKRRTFKEALSMRMKLMGDAGSRMIESAREAILLLDSFDQHASPEGRREGQHDYEDDQYQDTREYPQAYAGDNGVYPDYPPADIQHDYSYQQHPPLGDVAFPTSGPHHPDHSNLNALENASVTPSQSASQAAYGNRLSQQMTGGAYQRPAFQDGAPHESAEDRADSDASSEADVPATYPEQRHVNNFEQNLQQGQASEKAPALPSKDARPNFSTSRPPRELPPPQDHTFTSQQPPRQPQPQMFSVTAPRFNYDGAQLAPVPQAPRLYTRNEESSSDEEDTRPTTAHQGWSARPSRGNDDSSDEGQARPAPQPQRPKAEKRSSFLGKVGKLFKTDVRDGAAQNKSGESNHRRSESADRSASGVGSWHTRTDRNIKASRKESMRTLGTEHRSSVFQPLSAHGGGNDSSDDEEHRTDLVRVTNTNLQPKSRSDVGGSLRRTPSELARITAGPLSTKQRREQEEREQADIERRAREAVLGSGVGSAPPLSRSGTVRSTATTVKKKKKKAPSVAGSEVGTSATRAAPSTVNKNVGNGQAAPSNWVVSGDLSSGHRGLATLVLPSDLAKGDQSKPYPSIMPPTGLPPATSLSRSNSTSTAMGARPASTHSKSTAKSKKKKRHSAIAEGPSTGLVNMSTKDGGKYTTNSWVPQPQGGQGLAAQAVASAGVIPHTPAKGAEIAQKQTRESTTQSQAPEAPSVSSPLPAPVAMRPTSSQQSTPLKSALKHRTASPSPAPAAATPLDLDQALGSIPRAPPSASAILAEDKRTPIQPTTLSAPRLPDDHGDASAQRAEQLDIPSESKPAIGQDLSFDGSGRLDMSRSNSAQEGVEGAAPSLVERPTREKVPLPRLDMPQSEPFNIQFRRDQSAGPSAGGIVPATPLDNGQDVFLTPGEQAAYRHLFREPEGGNTPTREGIPDGARSTLDDPEGVTRIIANRVRVGGAGSSPSEAGEKQRPSAQPFDPRSAQPSRTYSSEGVTLHTSRSKDASPAPPAAAPLLSLVAPKAPTSDVSNLTAGSSGGAEMTRRKSVRLAPDTKLPPETPPALGGVFSGSNEHKGGDLFGGPKFETVTAPGSSLVSSNNPRHEHSGHEEHTAASGPQLSSRIAPPPQAPPRLPTKEEHPHLTSTFSPRESSGWSTRIDRRLAAGDDSSDEEYGAGGATAGEGADAYASARRAMGMASRHWKDATGSKKKEKKKGSASAASTPSKSRGKKAPTNGGYNPEIPLPKGMEVVGRQKASK